MNEWLTDEHFLARWLAGELTEAELETFRKDARYAQFEALAQQALLLQIPEIDIDANLQEIRAKRKPKTTQSTLIKKNRLSRQIWIPAAAILL
ncbi:MAG: hypothetical protein AAGD05_16665, partial [Bacteroidota bacterium]